MKYDSMDVASSYNHESKNVTHGKIAKKRKVAPLDVAVISSICAVVISTTVLLSRLISSGVISSALNFIS